MNPARPVRIIIGRRNPVVPDFPDLAPELSRRPNADRCTQETQTSWAPAPAAGARLHL